MLKQGKSSVDEYYKEMELLLVRIGIREDAESKMARFLGSLNEEIAGFVEMFPYHTLQDLVDQAMHTGRKFQQETRGKSHASHSIAAPWRKQQSSTHSVGDGPKVLQLGPLHLVLLQRWLFLQHHLHHISSDLLQV